MSTSHLIPETRIFQCENCGRTFERSLTRVKTGNTRFCSRRCVFSRHRSGGNGRALNPQGYVRLYILPDPTTGDRGGRVLEHRYLMERHLGRPLLPSEIIHHRNGDRADNRIQNLQVYTADSDHQRDGAYVNAGVHRKQARRRKTPVECNVCGQIALLLARGMCPRCYHRSRSKDLREGGWQRRPGYESRGLRHHPSTTAGV
jgi:hypothetical protein